MVSTTARIPIKSRPPRPKAEPEERIRILLNESIGAIADLINDGRAKNIIVMTGAGISTAAGIKDFRSPGTGLYDDLKKYNLPYPEAVFDINFFKDTPSPFYRLAKELYPGNFQPTLTHYLLPLLAKKNLLLRSYTQNIDSLERLSGLDEDLLVEAHGSFSSSKCIQCEVTLDPAWVKKRIFSDQIPYCKRCGGLVKPDLVFFGDSLPARFSTMSQIDFPQCDLLLVLGTSLKVEPFNKLITKVSPRCPRLLINREKVGQEMHSGFDFEDRWRYTVQRDALFLGNCDDGVRELSRLCGWEEELEAMYIAGHMQLKKEQEILARQEAPNNNVGSFKDDLVDDVIDSGEAHSLLDPGSEAATQTGLLQDSLDELVDIFGQSTRLSLLESQQSQPNLKATLASPASKTKDTALPQDQNGVSPPARNLNSSTAAKNVAPLETSHAATSVTLIDSSLHTKDDSPRIAIESSPPDASVSIPTTDTLRKDSRLNVISVAEIDPSVTKDSPQTTPTDSTTTTTTAENKACPPSVAVGGTDVPLKENLGTESLLSAVTYASLPASDGAVSFSPSAPEATAQMPSSSAPPVKESQHSSNISTEEDSDVGIVSVEVSVTAPLLGLGPTPLANVTPTLIAVPLFPSQPTGTPPRSCATGLTADLVLSNEEVALEQFSTLNSLPVPSSVLASTPKPTASNPHSHSLLAPTVATSSDCRSLGGKTLPPFRSTFVTATDAAQWTDPATGPFSAAVSFTLSESSAWTMKSIKGTAGAEAGTKVLTVSVGVDGHEHDHEHDDQDHGSSSIQDRLAVQYPFHFNLHRQLAGGQEGMAHANHDRPGSQGSPSGGGPGSLQMRRKRRKDYEPVSWIGTLKGEFRCLRGAGLVGGCGRVSKRRRVV